MHDIMKLNRSKSACRIHWDCLPLLLALMLRRVFHHPTDTGFPDEGYFRNPVSEPDVSNRLNIQRHFYRAYACLAKYFLMTQKLLQIRTLAYIPILGPGG